MINSNKARIPGPILNRGLIAVTTVLAALALQAQRSETPAQIKPGHSYGQSALEHQSGLTARQFIKEAAQGNLAEIRLAQMGAQKAQNAELKDFSEKLANDHKKAQQKLQKVAKEEHVMLPTSLDAMHQQKIDQLEQLRGDNFDQAFAKQLLQDHAMAISKYQRASRQIEDQNVKDYAQNTLDHLKEHMEKARETAKAVGLDEATIASLSRPVAEGIGSPGAGFETEHGIGPDQDRQFDKTPEPGPQP